MEGRAKRAAALITLLFAVISFRFFTRPADPGHADSSILNLVETFTPPYELVKERHHEAPYENPLLLPTSILLLGLFFH
jgi:hypothetical protein